MEAYLSSTKPRHDSTAPRADSLKPSHPSTSSSHRRAGSVNPAQGLSRPYESLTDAPKASASLTSKNMVQGGLRDRNKAIIKTLGKEDNPITNSTAYSRTMHIQVRLRLQIFSPVRETELFAGRRAARPGINPAEEGNAGPCTGTPNSSSKPPTRKHRHSRVSSPTSMATRVSCQSRGLDGLIGG